MHNKSFIFLLSAFMFFSCFSKSEENSKIEKDNNDSYDFVSPASVYYLPAELNEISGIQYLSDSQISCVQDEEGKIFIYNPNTKKIDQEIVFGKKGDYEDIVKVEDAYFILRNDGTIYKNTSGQTIEYNTYLGKENNTESLCYDKTSASILIGCKENGKVYSFDFKNPSMSVKPLFTINIKNFAPTAMAIHPISNFLYVLSKDRIAVLAKDGSAIEIINLKRKLFTQPEGISFRINGDMFISNEAAGGKANILEFKYKQDEK